MMNLKKSKIRIETNIERLALYYFKLAGVDTLEELKKSDYWLYFEQDKALALRTTRKKEFETKEKTPLKKDLFFKCSNCKKELGYQIFDSFMLDNLKFSYDNNILEIGCSCGQENIFHIPKGRSNEK